MAHDLNLSQIATAQSDNQHQTSNDADAQIGNALADILVVDFSGGNVTLTAAQFRSAMTFEPSGLSTGRDLTIPDVKRALFFVNNTDAADTITVKHGSASISVAAGQLGAFSTHGTANNLSGAVLATGSVFGGTASTTETLTGTNSSKAVTPDSLAALWEKGSDIASAGTITIGEGGYFHVTGTTTITDIDWGTAKDGRWAWLIFDGVLTLTHHATTLILPTGANITTAAGDRALIVQDNGDNAICVSYQRADGTALSAGSGAFVAASTTEVLTGTDTTKGVTPDALAALWEKGSDEASAGTVSFGEGGYFHVTGTTTITDLDWDTAKDGRTAWVIFDGALTLTHNATTLKLPGGANITTAAGDRALFVQDASDNVICLAYIKASGLPIAVPTVGTPFELEVAVSDETTSITTGTAKVTFYAPMDATLTEVFIGVTGQSSSGAVTADLNKNGSTMFSTNPSIDASEDTSLTGTAAVLSTTTWTKGDKMTIDVDAAGTSAEGLKMVIRGTRS